MGPRRGQRRALAALALGLLAVARPEGLGDVTDVRHWSYPDYTRVVVELTRSAEPAVGRIPADPAAGRPERLYVDLERVWVGRDYPGAIAVGDGLLQGIRLGQNTRTRTRVVLDLERYDAHRMLLLTHPHRVVLDVYAARDHPETLRWPGATRGRADPDRLPFEMRPLQTVVIDPGHGGRDPGAIGVGGLREKDVTLRLARSLRAPLEARGFRVMLTRREDRALDLEERTAIAEAARGDVFVSIHANASRRRAAQGIEIYYLDEDHERHSAGVAARENGVSLEAVTELQRTIARLRVARVSEHSRRLAQVVHGQIFRSLPVRYDPIHDLGVKKGPFYVLFLANMPAILVEAGFLTNKVEARRLRDDAYLAALAEQIAIGLTRFRERHATVAMGSGS